MKNRLIEAMSYKTIARILAVGSVMSLFHIAFFFGLLDNPISDVNSVSSFINVMKLGLDIILIGWIFSVPGFILLLFYLWQTRWQSPSGGFFWILSALYNFIGLIYGALALIEFLTWHRGISGFIHSLWTGIACTLSVIAFIKCRRF